MLKRLVIVSTIVGGFTGLSACGGARGKMRVDTPVIEFRKPDISEITGVDEPDSETDAAGSAAGATSAK